MAIPPSFTTRPMNPKGFWKPWITHTLGLGKSHVGQGFVLYPDNENTKAVRENNMVEGVVYRKKAGSSNGREAILLSTMV